LRVRSVASDINSRQFRAEEREHVEYSAAQREMALGSKGDYGQYSLSLFRRSVFSILHTIRLITLTIAQANQSQMRLRSCLLRRSIETSGDEGGRVLMEGPISIAEMSISLRPVSAEISFGAILENPGL